MGLGWRARRARWVLLGVPCMPSRRCSTATAPPPARMHPYPSPSPRCPSLPQVVGALEARDEMAAKMDSVRSLKVQASVSLKAEQLLLWLACVALALVSASPEWTASGACKCRRVRVLLLQPYCFTLHWGLGAWGVCLQQASHAALLGRPRMCSLTCPPPTHTHTTLASPHHCRRPSAASAATTLQSGGGPSARRTPMRWNEWR